MKKSMISILIIIIISGILHIDIIYAQTQNNASSELFPGLKYRCVGPTRGGRVTAVAGIPSQPSTFYMGAVGGGVWKTTDYGQSWFNVSDGYFNTGSIGAISVSLSNPDIVYVGTGSDGIRSNVIIGRGVYKSTDSGKTWQFLGLKKTGQIGAVIIHPENPDLVFIAALGSPFGPNKDRGIYRTKDGGNTWEKVLFISEKTGGIDLEFAPDNTQEIYASMWLAERKPWTIISGGREGGVYKSEDGGDSWKQLTNGLPNGIRGKSDLAVSSADPDRVYVLFEAPPEEGGLYRSDDRGKSFTLVSKYAPLLDRPFYYCNVDADPANADVVYVNSTRFFRSPDAGKTWNRLSTPHGDNHDMWINPNDPDLYIQSNDGGVNVTRDGGKTWSTQYNQPTAELYQVNVDDQFPYWLYAGQQDNSTIMVPGIPPYSLSIGHTGFWRSIGGCETGPAVPKPGNHNIVYANCKGRFGRYNKKTGQEQQFYVGAANIYSHNPKDLKYRFQRVSPIHVSPHDPDIVYHASQYLHRTRDDGETWETISPDLTAFEADKQVISGSPITRDITGEEFYSTIYAVQESPLEPGLIWVGANDGPVHVTRNAGETWENVTPEDLPKGGRIQTVEPSPHRPEKAYFAAYRYLLNDFKPYIYRTTDYGRTWRLLTTGKNGIPEDYPTRVIREDPDREGLLYAGTEFGMFISFDDGENWQEFQLNLPVTPVTDIKIYRKDLIMSTMGRSFWILDNVTLLHQIDESIKSSGLFLFTPREAYRMRYRSFRRGGIPEYPPAGAMIDYYISEIDTTKVLTLKIMDKQGETIREFSSADRRSELIKTPGINRFIWDMSYPGSSSGNRRMGSGPMAVPGTYFAELAVGDRIMKKKFTVKIDPRVAADGVTQADMVEQFNLSLKIQDLQNRANRTERDVRNALKKAGGSKKKKLENIHAQMATARGTYQTPMLLDQIRYLYSMLNRADQKPGNHAYIRYNELVKLYADVSAEFEKVK
ncbi:WD40/YVTN/BNR-like repeat-containing protein [candidate division KSB1 bacterium]